MASESHFSDHVSAVFLALPEEARGRAIARSPAASAQFASHGIKAVTSPAGGHDPVLVSSSADMRRSRLFGRQKVALMEHGAGQSYGGQRSASRNSSYAGGANREASLFLHPNEHAAARDRAAYPQARVEVVGSPILDTLPAREPGPGPVIAVSFHFDLGLVPETRNAFPWIRAELRRLAGSWTVLGHGHPRVIDQLAPWYAKNGIEVVHDFRDVCRRADLFIADNTSALFAFAATGRPVVVLNPPHYRRTANHGLRFWDASTVGINVDRPDALGAAVQTALEDPAQAKSDREAALGLVYAYRSGAAQRAADALVEWAA